MYNWDLIVRNFAICSEIWTSKEKVFKIKLEFVGFEFLESHENWITQCRLYIGFHFDFLALIRPHVTCLETSGTSNCGSKRSDLTFGTCFETGIIRTIDVMASQDRSILERIFASGIYELTSTPTKPEDGRRYAIRAPRPRMEPHFGVSRFERLHLWKYEPYLTLLPQS
jgi:hypothetical protein